ncbi:MAG: YicC family protein [Deltaproteobacteria bacterium]|nr:YicC family protein [Deltaproteobacteria bacterium]
MAKSMTGYGRGEFSIGTEVFSTEVKSLNHRFLDISLRTPERFALFENGIRDEIKKRFSRGSFTLYISSVSAEAPPLRLNLPMARLYAEAALELERELGIKSELNALAMLRLKDIFTFEKKGHFTEADWEPVKQGLHAAFAEVEEWRIKEGANLKEDLLSRISTVEKLLSGIMERSPEVLEEHKARLAAEMEKLVGSTVDPQRILLEAAVFAERSDINEEITRLKSHLDMFRKFLKFGEPVGKRLDFLCQEIGRETNTIGSKPSDISITQTVIEMKGEVEKIREQVQNIE